MADRNRGRKKHFAPVKARAAERLASKSQNWNPVREIKDGMIVTRSESGGRKYIKALEIIPINFHMRTAADRADIIDRYFEWLKISPSRFQITISTASIDTQKLVTNILMSTAGEPNEIRAKSLAYTKQIQGISSAMATGKKYILSYEYDAGEDGRKSTDETEIAKQLNAVATEIKARFRDMDMGVASHDDENGFLRELMYHSMNEDDIRGETLKGREIRLRRDMTLSGISESAQIPDSVITAPASISFPDPRYMIEDGIYRTHLYITPESIPRRVLGGWLDIMTNFGPEVAVSVHAYKKNRDATISQSRFALRQEKISYNLSVSNNELKAQEYGEKYNNRTYVMNRMRNSMEDLFDVCIIIAIKATSLEELTRMQKYVRKTLRMKDIIAEDLYARHEAAFLMCLPICHRDPSIFAKARRNFLTSSVASMFPYTAYQLFEPTGVLFGINENNNSLAVIDLWNTRRRSNANGLITGSVGSGKTFTEMLLSSHLRFTGIQVLFVLPMKGYEYENAVSRMHGTFIRLLPGAPACVNLFEIRRADVSSGIGNTSHDKPLLTKKISQIQVFLSLLARHTLDAATINRLDKTLVTMYNRFGITEDNASILEEDGTLKRMPTFSDFDAELAKHPDMDMIRGLILPFVSGTCRNMNGQTNLDLSNKCIAFDVDSDVISETLLPAFLFLAIDMCYDIIKRDRTEKNLLFLDEVWRMTINKDAGDFVKELFKIVRGYGAGVWAATQEIDNFVSQQGGTISQTLINNAATKIALRAEPSEAAQIQQLMNLNEQETKRITRFERGHGLLITARDRAPIAFTATKEEVEAFTTDINILSQIRKEEEAKQLLKTQK